MSNQLLGSMGGINAAEANAVNDLNTERLRVQTQYQNAIAEAIANGDMARAQALYQEAVRVDEGLIAQSRAQADENYRAWSATQTVTGNYQNQLLQQAETLAAYGDFSGYKALGYTDEQIAQMKAYWSYLNPNFGISNNYGGGSYSSGGGNVGNDPITPTGTPIGNAKDLGGNAKNLYYQLYSIPGLTSTNKVALVEQAAQSGKISGSEEAFLLNYLGY